jgi:hypothetical protein
MDWAFRGGRLQLNCESNPTVNLVGLPAVVSVNIIDIVYMYVQYRNTVTLYRWYVCMLEILPKEFV